MKCVANKFKEIESTTGSSKIATICMCHILDMPYDEKVYDNLASSGDFVFGIYLKNFNNNQYKGKTYLTNILNNDFGAPIEKDSDEKPVTERPEDLKNRMYCLSQLCYDPFVDNTAKDRIFLFNILADYLTDDIIEDPHRLQSVVPLVKSILQESKFDKMIDNEQKCQAPNIDLIKMYVDSKEKLRKTINSTASENGLSVKGSGKSARGASTLTGIMREMLENNFEDVKVNVFDAKMNGAFKSIADISNKSLIEQINPQSDDYARMVTTQREIIQRYDEENSSLEEQIRLLKIENKKLQETINGDGDLNDNI